MRRMVAVFLLAAWPAQGWWDEGHQVVARIAAAHLTREARARVAELLGVEDDPDGVADGLAKAAVWADGVKEETSSGDWHFLNWAWQDNRANLADRCWNDDCVTARVKLFAAQLKSDEADETARFSDAEALRFLVHFVGDLHQPLHVSNNADEGGQCEVLEEAIGRAETLHELWDGELVSRMGEDDAALAAELNIEIGAMSERSRGDFAAGEVEDWAWEAHRLAIADVYKRLGIRKQEAAEIVGCNSASDEIQGMRVKVDEKYMDEMEPVVREQLKKAGLRLAEMLNTIFE